MLNMMLEIEPTWVDLVKVVFTDEKLSHDSVTELLPSVKTFLCWWHLVYRDLENVRNCGRLAEHPTIQDFIINNFVYGVNETHIEEKWAEFQAILSGKATHYMATWMNRRKKWCSPWWSTELAKLVFQNGK
jgi:hypothetical protein